MALPGLAWGGAGREMPGSAFHDSLLGPGGSEPRRDTPAGNSCPGLVGDAAKAILPATTREQHSAACFTVRPL